ASNASAGDQFRMSSPRYGSSTAYTLASDTAAPTVGRNSSRSFMSTTTKPGLSSPPCMRATDGTSVLTGKAVSEATSNAPARARPSSSAAIARTSSAVRRLASCSSTPVAISRSACTDSDGNAGTSCLDVASGISMPVFIAAILPPLFVSDRKSQRRIRHDLFPWPFRNRGGQSHVEAELDRVPVHTSLWLCDLSQQSGRALLVNEGGARLLPVLMKNPDLLGEDSCNRQRREILDGKPADLARLVASERQVDDAFSFTDEEELVYVSVIGWLVGPLLAIDHRSQVHGAHCEARLFFDLAFDGLPRRFEHVAPASGKGPPVPVGDLSH